MPLTKVGQRTLEGFKKKYGPDKGEAYFYSAMNKGTIEATKMEKKGGAIRKRQAAEKDKS